MPGSQLSRSPEIAAIKHTDTANHHHWHLLLLLLLVLVVAASLSLSRVTPPLETKQNSFFLIFGNFLLRLFSLFPAHFERPQCDDVRRFSRRGGWTRTSYAQLWNPVWRSVIAQLMVVSGVGKKKKDVTVIRSDVFNSPQKWKWNQIDATIYQIRLYSQTRECL